MPFYDGEIDLIVRDFICAQCYADLHKQPVEDRKWLAVCPVHGDVEKVGRVTRRWAIAEGQRRASWRKEIEYREPELYNPHYGKSAEQLLKELGF